MSRPASKESEVFFVLQDAYHRQLRRIEAVKREEDKKLHEFKLLAQKRAQLETDAADLKRGLEAATQIARGQKGFM